MVGRKRVVWGACTLTALAIAGCGGTQTGDMSGYNTGANSLNNTPDVSSATSFGAATLGSKLLPVKGKATFVVGMNISSFAAQPDLDFGKNPLQPSAETTYSSKSVVAAYQDINGVGCNVVRLRLFTKLDGLKIDSNGLVTGLDDTFVKNLGDALDKAEANKLQVYVCLTPSWKDIATVKDPVSDAAARTAFLKKAVTPLIGKLKGRSSVMALDLFDEIESEVAGKDGNGTDKGVTWDQAREFIKATADIVKSVDPQRLVSCGSGLHDFQNIKAGKFSKLGLDFYDFHIYSDTGVLPQVKELRVDRPVLVGSCGPSSKSATSEVQAKAVSMFLTSALKDGYAGAVVTDYSRDAASALSLLDKDGKRKQAMTDVQTFVAAMPPATGSGTGLGQGK